MSVASDPKVIAMAKRMAAFRVMRLPANIERDDLEQAALLAAHIAAPKWRDGGAPMLKYLARRMLGAIEDELRAFDFMSRRDRRLSRMIDADLGSCCSQPDWPGVADRLGVTVDEVHRIRALRLAGQQSMSSDADEAVNREGEVDPPEAGLELRQQARLVMDEIERLPEIMRRVLLMRYDDGMTQEQIGEVFGVTASRVCQIEANATSLLRKGILLANADFQLTQAGGRPHPMPGIKVPEIPIQDLFDPEIVRGASAALLAPTSQGGDKLTR